jgi:adenosylcobinamide-phosphate synthase
VPVESRTIPEAACASEHPPAPRSGLTGSDLAPWLACLASPGVLGAALAIDLLFGELPTRLHPVVWMGTLVRWVERGFPRQGPLRQLTAGALCALLLPSAFALATLLLLRTLERWPLAHWLSQVLLLTGMFAARALGDAARQVKQALDRAELQTARAGLRSLCSRDPSRLAAADLVGASVESLAENASDSFVAPLFYYALFGLPGAVFYRAVNTLDSMLGYHGHYEYLGKASARLDDLLNFIPARITALLILFAGALRGMNVRRAIVIWRRDAATTESPNAGRPMAAMAGLLGVRLEKAEHYQLGDAVEPLVSQKIDDAWSVVQLAGGVCVALTLTALAVAARSG